MTKIDSESIDKSNELSIADKNAIEFVSILAQLELSAALHKNRNLTSSLRYSAKKIIERTTDPTLIKILLNIHNHPNPSLQLKVWRKRLEEAAGGKVHW
jgi:hypothetical protein